MRKVLAAWGMAAVLVTPTGALPQEAKSRLAKELEIMQPEKVDACIRASLDSQSDIANQPPLRCMRMGGRFNVAVTDIQDGILKCHAARYTKSPTEPALMVLVMTGGTVVAALAGIKEEPLQAVLSKGELTFKKGNPPARDEADALKKLMQKALLACSSKEGAPA